MLMSMVLTASVDHVGVLSLAVSRGFINIRGLCYHQMPHGYSWGFFAAWSLLMSAGHALSLGRVVVHDLCCSEGRDSVCGTAAAVLISKLYTAIGDQVEDCGPCWHQRPCECLWSVPVFIIKVKETSLALVSITTDSQLRGIEGFCDHFSLPYAPPHP